MKRKCTLHNAVTITQGVLKDWQPFEAFHYRRGPLGVVDKVFVMRRKGEPVGIIIYGMPVPNIAMRNQVTRGRYTGSGRLMSLGLLNAELRTIKRVVIDPQYRGAGLGRRLVCETLERAGTVLVEAVAVMGRVNSFLERAGMAGYPQSPPEKSIRLQGALDAVGIQRRQVACSYQLTQAIAQLPNGDRQFIMAELRLFAQAYCHNERQRKIIDDSHESIKRYAKITVAHLNSTGIYYLWKRNTQTGATYENETDPFRETC